MSEVWTAILVVIVAGCLGWGFIRTERTYEFPFLAGVVVCGFVLPQLPSLIDDPFVSREAYTKTIFMTILCLLAALFGWAASDAPSKLLRASFCERRLGHLAIFFSLIGAYFYFVLSKLPGEVIVGVQMSGAPVMYVFFAQMLTYGLAIACLCFARRPSRLMLAVIAFDLIFYFDRIIVTGKRGEAAELVMIFLLSYWFHRRIKMPRVGWLFAAVVGAVAMASVSSYRDITRANSGLVWDQLVEIDPVGNISDLLENGGLEMRNAITLIEATAASGRFDFGAVHWNQVIWNFVPAQIVGSSFKASLMLPTPPAPRYFNPPTGTTLTGMADAFRSFWYFGALKFFLLAYVMRRIWASAMAGEAAAQLLYMLSVVPAMLAFSHASDWIVPVWIHMLIFLAPALAYAAVPRPAERPAPPTRQSVPAINDRMLRENA